MAISAKSKRYRSDAIGRTKKAVKHARYYWLMLAESHFMRRAFIMAVTVVGAAFAIQRAHGQPPPFTFSKVDLKLLEESEALDRQIEKRALVYAPRPCGETRKLGTGCRSLKHHRRTNAIVAESGWLAKRKRALLESNPPRNNQSETHPDDERGLGLFGSGPHRMDRFPDASQNSFTPPR